ncbi:MAG: glutaredoxin family protein [Gammaproteobacteria bacterium]|nr:glutaredoxin family protein [Gammaproteobacteria bacterium]
MVQFDLFIRHGCHLCDRMRAELYPYEQQGRATVRVHDVDADPTLCERYGLRVPVLCLGDEVLAEFFLDPSTVEQRLQRVGGEPR